MSEEYYRDEYPDGGGPGGGETGGGDENPDWGESWGGGSGGGGSGGDGGGIHGEWGGDPPEGQPDPPDDEPEWGGDEPEKVNLPLLKVSRSGRLLRRGNYLLHGSLTCKLKPQILIYLPHESNATHLDCALYRITDPARTIYAETVASSRLKKFYVSWARPGKFELQIKWQRGHYNHAECGQMQLVVFGLNQGWNVMPLSCWKKVAVIEITPDHRVYVNDIRGKINSDEILF